MLLTQIDGLLLGGFAYLDNEDQCYFLRDYTARQTFAYSDTNSLISNLKKSPRLRGTAQWRHKEAAITRFAEELGESLSAQWLERTTLVPIPPSKTRSDPEYDDRMVRVLRRLEGFRACDVREMIVQTRTVPAAHLSTLRPRPEELVGMYEIEEEATEPWPERIALVDDIITTGSHFKAAKTVLEGRFPSAEFFGIFWARTVRL